MAVMLPSSDAQSSTVNGFASPKMSRMVCVPGPSACTPLKYNPPSTPSTTTSTGIPAFHQRSGVPSGGSIAPPEVSVISVAPGRYSPPPEAARTSAACMGPKSRRIQITSSTKTSASSG